MRRLWWLFAMMIWGVMSGLAGADGDVTAELVQVNTARYPEITLYVSVKDRAGQIIEGLQQSDFRVTEDGVPVDVIAFSAGARSAIATVLTLDRSGSMGVEKKLEGAKTASVTFVDLMREHDKVALVAFDNRVVTLQPFTSDKEALKKQIRSVNTGDCTAWYDAVYQSVDLISALDGRRSVILLSDGIDCREDLARRLLGNGSKHTLDEAIERARQVGIPVYAIGLGQQATQKVSNEGFDEVKLRRVASETGGKYYHAPSAAELKELYRSLSVEMQKEYTLTYRSPRPTYDGTRRNIAVSIQRAGGAGVTTEGRYVEQHLVNFRSDPRLFLMLFLPLLLMLLVPIVPRQLAKARAQQARGVSEAISDRAGANRVEPTPPPIAPASPVPPVIPVMQQPAVSLGPRPAPLPAVPPAVASVVPAPQPSRLAVRYPLGTGETTIGRAAENAIVLTDPSVALQHARIMEVSGRYVVRDLSSGQTLVSYRGDPTQERATTENALQDGSIVRFGQVQCVFRHVVADLGAWLEVSFPLGAPMTIGRDLANRVVVNLPKVELRQVEIRQEAGRWVAYNFGAGGSVLVSFNGDPTQAHPVQELNAVRVGSTICVGNVVLELRS